MALEYGTIGGLTMLEMKGGIVAPMGEDVEIITRPGVDGVAAKKIGKMPQETAFQTLAGVTNDAALIALRASYLSLKGTLVTVQEPGVTGASNDYENVLVIDVTPGEPMAVAQTTFGYVWLLPATWRLMITEVS